MEAFFEIILALVLIAYVIRIASPYILAYFLKKLEKKVRSKFTHDNSSSMSLWITCWFFLNVEIEYLLITDLWDIKNYVSHNRFTKCARPDSEVF